MPSLTRAEAAERAALLSVDAYTIDLDLSSPDATFDATTVVRFGCRRPGAETFVELRPDTLHSVTLNGRELDVAALDDNRLWLTDLAADNELVVRATMAYSNSGEGLHRFVDPADGEVYLYAHTFLDAAQRIFACFDQPDLKAPVTLTVTAPAAWTVLANGAGERVAPGRWRFATTPPLATYFVTLVAGPLHSRYAEHGAIPLGIHCRAALAQALDRDADELFEVTAACFDRYQELFASPYPFGKYDQVFVPEFNGGAMENPGCVTFRDEYVFRSAVTRAQRMERAVVIAHEMAHMWFGDLVTMRWWDDLWLNESFAEYLGTRVAGEATRFTDTWTDFAISRKTWGYAADQRPSAHPVAPERVDDSADALLNFDGISYAKGAAALRQLATYVGDEAFLAGLRKYFAAHGYGNATLADLLTSLGEVSGRDLWGWAALWLRESGVTTLRPAGEVGPGGRYTAVSVVQTAPSSNPVLRPHRLALGLYDRGADGRVTRRERVEVEVEPDHERTPVPALTGRPAAALLLVNDDDLTYAKTRLADRDLAALPELLPAVADPVARALLWSAAWDSTRDAEADPTGFVNLAVVGLPTELDPGVFAQVIGFAADITAGQYLTAARRPGALAALASACAEVLASVPAGSDRQLAAARGLVRCAGPGEVETLRGWLGGRNAPDGLAIDADLRWAVLGRLVVLGAAGTADIDDESERDRSAHGVQHAARCRAALPDAGEKARAWDAIAADETLSNRSLLALAEGFWQPEQEELTAAYVSRYFQDMPTMAARRSAQVVSQVAGAAYPRYAVRAATAEAAQRLLDRTDLPAVLRRVIGDRTDDLRRALAVRSLISG
ncbi:aminopeptidase N [Planosporangium flavigriseum]|uniref:Aminopeptidase N n=1 Tax=Planosporangium flavigriseum TaxID=373681 RepID=A0A8J3PPG8_9ACTN|nr:aminopeptidase N [Planosporangium flavigriseum]NJC66492.1 aminopeptidase N [Planosporangium flavigriseum]GIG76369.1 aminopeptidase [Planosporangium flavigriseum]